MFFRINRFLEREDEDEGDVFMELGVFVGGSVLGEGYEIVFGFCVVGVFLILL